MTTKYILGSLDQPLYLIIHCSHEGAKQVCYYSTTNEEAEATRFDHMSLAALRLGFLEIAYPVITALNIIPLPIVEGKVDYQPTLGL